MNLAQPLERLNHALNREVSTFLRYMLQASMIKGAPWETVRSMYAGEVQGEVGHAQALAQAIVNLGGLPKLSPELTAPPGDARNRLQAGAR
jgi:bacterioferritin (cytochrome b1)